eukprot:GEMP01012346.1.p1 GENE.GEMP01012346.1~~GEMP01012346.1.p1  ORF type:complete len:592 (+),score=167.96 GEMP01012346.1:494-2269(+)
MGADGSVLVSDANNHRIIKLGSGGGDVETVAGGEQAGFANGPAHAANFRCPWGITVNPVGDVFVADRDNHRIRKIDVRTGEVSTVAGTGSQGWRDGEACEAQFNRPSGVAIGMDGCVYISEVGNHCIRKLDLVDGSVVTLVGVAEEGSCDGEDGKAQLLRPDGLALGHDGVVYVADGENHCIRAIIKKTESELEDIEKELAQKEQQQGVLTKDLEKAVALTHAAKQDLEKTKSAMTRANEQLTEVQNKLKEKRLILHSIVVRRKATLHVIRDKVSKMESAKQKQISEFSSVKAELMKARTARYKVAMEIAAGAQELKRVDQQLKKAMEDTDMTQPIVSDTEQMEYDSGMIGGADMNEFMAVKIEEGPGTWTKTTKKGDEHREMAAVTREKAVVPREIAAAPSEMAIASREMVAVPREMGGEPREIAGDPRNVDGMLCEVAGEPGEGAAEPREVSIEPREMAGERRELVGSEPCEAADWTRPLKRNRTQERDLQDATMKKQRKTPSDEGKTDVAGPLPLVTDKVEMPVGINNGAAELDLDLDLDAVNAAMQETQRVLDKAIEVNKLFEKVTVPSECEQTDHLDAKKEEICQD